MFGRNKNDDRQVLSDMMEKQKRYEALVRAFHADIYRYAYWLVKDKAVAERSRKRAAQNPRIGRNDRHPAKINESDFERGLQIRERHSGCRQSPLPARDNFGTRLFY